jgi:ribonuclease P protein component
MPRRLGRLKRRQEFLRVAAARRKWAAPGMVVQAARRRGADGSDGEEARVGFTVSKKVGNAVTRNRARRRLRAAAEEVMPNLAEAGTDYVLIGRQATPTRPFAALKQDLETALRRLAGAPDKRRAGSRRRGEHKPGAKIDT